MSSSFLSPENFLDTTTTIIGIGTIGIGQTILLNKELFVPPPTFIGYKIGLEELLMER
jgi:hypothetical protein